MHDEFPRGDEENEAPDLECYFVRHGFEIQLPFTLA
jgi:hypothetical protein